jgi:hypothetical protein
MTSNDQSPAKPRSFSPGSHASGGSVHAIDQADIDAIGRRSARARVLRGGDERGVRQLLQALRTDEGRRRRMLDLGHQSKPTLVIEQNAGDRNRDQPDGGEDAEPEMGVESDLADLAPRALGGGGRRRADAALR